MHAKRRMLILLYLVQYKYGKIHFYFFLNVPFLFNLIELKQILKCIQKNSFSIDTKFKDSSVIMS